LRDLAFIVLILPSFSMPFASSFRAKGRDLAGDMSYHARLAAAD
jgi:hypothetical protein